MNIKKIETDVLVVGGGTAGCFLAYKLGLDPSVRILIAEKANIKRSGCLAAGVNALNAYITKGKTPQFYVDYAKKDAHGIVREDLLLSMSERLNSVTKDLEDLGLVILKDENGEYVARGTRNIKINGENIKPLLADAAKSRKNVEIINHINITSLKSATINNVKTVYGAYGFGVNDDVFYDITAKVVLVATGGASGLYRPNNPGFSRHKMWYSPFNTGAGYSMGLRAGAEMTTFEMRFIALRCKDTIAPTGTIAQGVPAKQVNSRGEVYEDKYGLTTSERVYGTVSENMAGRGPCYLRTQGITETQEQDLYRAYLNMAPSQTLKWLEKGAGPSVANVEIEGTEPYVVGGHTASVFWINNERETTVRNLYAAGDVAGGCPQKYVTGALAEAEIAANAIQERLKSITEVPNVASENTEFEQYEKYLEAPESRFSVDDVEEALQKIMDVYAGGISTHYQYNEASLDIAERNLDGLKPLIDTLSAKDHYELMKIYELRERLLVAEVLIAHLRARKETRWHSFAENTDYPEKNPEFEKYVNSRLQDGKIEIIFRDLVKLEDKNEHQN